MSRPEASRRGGEAEEVADRLHSAAIRLLRTLRKADAASGVSAARLSALSVLVFGGPLALGELAAAEQVRPPTMSRIVAGLEAEGLVRREVDPEDRRLVRVRATGKGVRLLERARRRRVADLAERLEALDGRSLARIEEATRILQRIVGR